MRTVINEGCRLVGILLMLFVCTPAMAQDLVITQIDDSALTTDPQSLRFNGNITVGFANTGAVNVAQNYRITLFLDNDQNGQYNDMNDRTLGWIDVTGTTAANGNFTTALNGVTGTRTFVNQPIYGFIDSQAVVAETNENNNIFTSGQTICGAQNRPDVTSSRIQYDFSMYPMQVGLVARVGNGGIASIPAGVTVHFYDGDPSNGGTLIGSSATTTALAQNAFEDVSTMWVMPPANATYNSLSVFTVVDQSNTQTECREDNNRHDILMPIAANLTTPADGSAIQDTTPTIAGTGEADTTVNFVIKDQFGNDRVTATNIRVDAQGNWSIDIPNALGDGTYTVELTAFDAVGNQGLTRTYTFTIDTMVAVVISRPSDGQTVGDDTPTISGLSDPNASIQVSVRDSQGNLLQTLNTTSNAQGEWSIDAMMLAMGSYVVTVTATDPAGNVAMAGPVTFTLDATPPSVAITSPNDGAVFATNTFQVTGTAESGALLSLAFIDEQGNTVRTRNLMVPNNGMWSVGSGAFADGLYQIVATATDAAGNAASTPARQVRIDTISPTTVILTPVVNGRTNDTTPQITGTTEVGATLTLVIRDAQGNVVQTINNVPVDAQGNWSADAMMLGEGTYTVTATAQDAAGNMSVEGPRTFAVDLSVSTLTITNPADGSSTSSRRPAITGSTEPSATVVVTVRDTNGNVIQTNTVQADAATGAWQVALQMDLNDGDYTVEANATDIAGNMTMVTNGFTVDTSALPLTIDSPANGAAIANQTPEVVGTTAPNETVAVTVTDAQGNVIQSLNVTADAQGNWRFNVMTTGDGDYVVNATVTNQAGTSSMASTNFTIDTTSPPLTITSPVTNTITNDNTPAIAGTSDAGATVDIEIKDSNGQVVQTINDVPVNAQGMWQVDAMTLPDGDYTIEVTAKDGAGNTQSGSVNVAVDTVAPSVAITAPMDNSTASTRQVNITGTSDPSQSVTVEVLDAQGNVIQTRTILADAQGAWQIQTNMLQNGQYTARATASDAAGNSAVDQVNFSVDSDMPNLTITAPTNGTATQQTRPAITGQADPDAMVRIVIRDANGNTVETIDAQVDAQGNFNATPSQDLAEGGYVITVTATRPNGKMASDDVTIRVDQTPPATAITQPTEGATTGDDTPDITGTSEPGADVAVTVKDNMGMVVFQTTVQADAQGNWSAMSPMLPMGQYSVEADATDAAGNTASATPVNFTIAFDAPTVSITSPTMGQTVEDLTPTIAGTSKPGSIVEVFVDGKKIGEARADDQGVWSLTVDRPLDEGEHTIEATTKDDQGREGSSGVITVTIKAPEMVRDVTILTPTKGQTVDGSSVTVTGEGEPGSTVTVTIGDQETDVVVGEDGTWSTTIDNVPEGTTTITAKSGDKEVEVVVIVERNDPSDVTYKVVGGACTSTPAPAPSPLWLLVAFGVIGLWRRRTR